MSLSAYDASDYGYEEGPEPTSVELEIRQILDQFRAYHPETGVSARHHLIEWMMTEFPDAPSRLAGLQGFLVWYKMARKGADGSTIYDPFNVRQRGFNVAIREHEKFQVLTPDAPTPTPKILAIKPPERLGGDKFWNYIDSLKGESLSAAKAEKKALTDWQSRIESVLSPQPSAGKKSALSEARSEYTQKLQARIREIDSTIKVISLQQQRRVRIEKVKDIWNSPDAQGFRRSIMPTLAWAEAKKDGALAPTQKHYDAAKAVISKIQHSGSLSRKEWDKQIRDEYGKAPLLRSKVDSLREMLKDVGAKPKVDKPKVEKQAPPKVEDGLVAKPDPNAPKHRPK